MRAASALVLMVVYINIQDLRMHLFVFGIIIPHVKIISRDWLSEVHHLMQWCSRGNVTPLRWTFSDFS